ncbi:hypothetical protein ACFLTH_15670, partial [Bacteroidota bacterium]
MKYYYKKTLILLISSVLVSCQSSDITTPTEQISAVLNIVSGQYQSGDNGEKLEEPIVIMVTDSANNPLSDIQISFYVIDGGGGAVDDNIVFSNSGGFAETYWTLGNGPEHIMKV